MLILIVGVHLYACRKKRLEVKPVLFRTMAKFSIGRESVSGHAAFSTATCMATIHHADIEGNWQDYRKVDDDFMGEASRAVKREYISLDIGHC